MLGVVNGVDVGGGGTTGGMAPADVTESPAKRTPDTTAIPTRRHLIEEGAYAMGTEREKSTGRVTSIRDVGASPAGLTLKVSEVFREPNQR